MKEEREDEREKRGREREKESVLHLSAQLVSNKAAKLKGKGN